MDAPERIPQREEVQAWHTGETAEVRVHISVWVLLASCAQREKKVYKMCVKINLELVTLICL